MWPLKGAIIMTTPQDLSLNDACRGDACQEGSCAVVVNNDRRP